MPFTCMKYLKWFQLCNLLTEGVFFLHLFLFSFKYLDLLIISNFKGRVKRKNQRKAAGGGAAAEDED